MTTTIRNGRGDLITAIGGPCDVQALPESQLPELAVQMRRRLIETVTATGGHLGAGLGMVELTIALHRVFTSPHDIVVFDTGHQTYPHKLLTGRGKDFATLRQADGLSGYPNRHESPHDWVENSHASVSLAWVDGIAKALALQGQCDRRVIAVIGDGEHIAFKLWRIGRGTAAHPCRRRSVARVGGYRNTANRHTRRCGLPRHFTARRR